MRAAKFDLELTPRQRDGAWVGFDVRYIADAPEVAAGQAVLSVPQTVVSIPGTPYRTEDLTVSDAEGPLTLSESAATADSSGEYRHWTADRATRGALTVVFHAPVRPHDEHTPVGPLFDLRAEDLGLFGAGITFLPLPGDVMHGAAPSYEISLTWHLAEGVEAVSSRGIGDQAWCGPLQSVAFCCYAAGTPHRAPADSTDFAIHSYSVTPFDLDAMADYVRNLHTAFARFFEDPTSHYQILIRKHLGRGTGGTAFPDSFAFGYSAVDETDPTELRSLLAHEMAHNWPTLDADHSTTSWYTEGTAEYYSHVLPLRAEFLSAEEFAAQLTDRFQQYDSNALRELDNAAASAAYWTDPRAQRIPYGRGLRYLIATDGEIRLASDGAASLDDVVLDILRCQRAGGKVDVDGWIERVAMYLGPDASERYASMAAGNPIPLPDITFEGRVRPVASSVEEWQLGFDVSSFGGEGGRVTGLVPGSQAERAGLRNGDELVERALPFHAIRHSDHEIELAVIRRGEPLTLRYLPAGARVASLIWKVSA